LVGALLAGTALSIALFCLVLRPRPDIGDALHSSAFLLKALVVLCLAATAATAVIEAALPTAPRRGRKVLWVAPAVLVVMLIAELISVPASAWPARWIGHNAVHCLTLIPILSAAPAIGLLIAMKHGAPSSPTRAGAIAGLMAGAIGACLYAITCPDDSPLFIASWYTLAIVATTAACAAAGHRILRW
jgi:hypothetical protein